MFKQVLENFVFILIISFLCLILSFNLVIYTNKNTTIYILLQIAIIAQYMFLFFKSMKNQAFSDLGKIKRGAIKKDFFWGVKIGFLANSLYNITFILLLVGKMFGINAFLKAFVLINSPFMITTARFMPNGLGSELSLLEIVILFLLGLVIPTAMGLGYVAGLKEINILRDLQYKKK